MKLGNYKISWKHNNNNDRRIFKLKLSKIFDSELDRSGSTECYIRNFETKEVVSAGRSICQPTDNYNKRLGRYLSFNRAISKLPIDERKELWASILKTDIVKKLKKTEKVK